MKIELSGDYKRKSVIEFDGKIHELDINSEESSLDDDIHIICKVQRNADLTRIESEVVASAMQECSRCLESFRHGIIGKFSIVICHLKKGETIPDYSEDDVDKDEDSLVYLFYGESSIDITENVHDALLLSVPFNPVCKENCKGLCPVCGNNLNVSDCGCVNKSDDSRWQALSGLLYNSTNDKE